MRKRKKKKKKVLDEICKVYLRLCDMCNRKVQLDRLEHHAICI